MPFAAGPAPGRTEASTIYRPFVPIRVAGTAGSLALYALLDTGADETVLPGHLIPQIGVQIDTGTTARFRGVGGHLVTVSFGRIELAIGQGARAHRWPVTAAFLEGSGLAILGHAGFLQYFTATFNGRRRHVTLSANGSLPAIHAP